MNAGWAFPSKRARSGYITDREVSKQWLEAKRLAGIPKPVILYCARHRFSTDAMEGTQKRARGDGRDGARVDQYHAHLHALERETD